MHNETLTVMEIYDYLLESAQDYRESGDDEIATERYYIAGLLEKTEEVSPKEKATHASHKKTLDGFFQGLTK